MPQKASLLVLVLVVALVACILAAGCSSSSQAQSSDETPMATTTTVTTIAATTTVTTVAATVAQASTTSIDIYDVDADFLSSGRMGVDVTVKNTGTVTAKNVVVGLVIVDGDHLDMMYQSTGIKLLLEDDILCLDREVVGDIAAGGYATASLRYYTDDLFDDWYLMKVAMADNAEAVVY